MSNLMSNSFVVLLVSFAKLCKIAMNDKKKEKKQRILLLIIVKEIFLHKNKSKLLEN